MAEAKCKYYKQKKQVSYDNGVTWADVIPYEYQQGDLYEMESQDCGYVPPVTEYRWVKTNDTTCVESSEGEYENQYLTFIALSSQASYSIFSRETDDKIYYSIDSGSTWTELVSNTWTPMIASGSKIMWKGNISSGPIGKFAVNAEYITIEGNIMSLLYGDDFRGKTSLKGINRIFNYLFANHEFVGARNLVLPATTLTDKCYNGMFRGCDKLGSTPQLPATTLADYCYCEMFYGCTSLKKAPELSALNLEESCYSGMFQGCTRLNYIKCLATNISATNCTNSWVSGVSSTGTFVTPSSTNWTSGANGIPEGWTRVNA